MFPRGGGIWDQDPELIRDFRAIREFELQWKNTQEQLGRAGGELTGGGQEGGGLDLEQALEQHLDDLGEDGYF